MIFISIKIRNLEVRRFSCYTPFLELNASFPSMYLVIERHEQNPSAERPSET